MNKKTEVKLVSMLPCMFALIIGIISKPDRWIDVSFMTWLFGLICFPLVYIVVHNIIPVNVEGVK